MNDKQALAAACALTGDPVEAVVSYRLTGHSIRLVVDRGIAGSPLIELDLDQLTPPPPPAAKAEPESKAEPEAPPARKRSAKK